MEKQEYRIKTEQMLQYMSEKSYKQAGDIADSINWKRVKNVSMLCAVSEIYEYNGEYEKSREILFLAYERSPESRKVVYRLSTLALKLNEISEAEDCFEEFVKLAPKDPNQYVLKYKILKSKNAPLEEQIEVLKKFKSSEYVEKWAYELALLYHKAGMTEECLAECDDMTLWFDDSKYVKKAMDLKQVYKPLTPLQQEKYKLYSKPEIVPEEVEVPAEEKETGTVVLVKETEESAEVVEETVEPETEVTEEAAEPEAEVAEEVTEPEAAVEMKEPEESKQQTSTLSIEEMLQEWEAKQKENAQIIEAEYKKAEQEKEQEEALKAPEEEQEEDILPDDIRRLMEELETEAADIAQQKKQQEVAEESVKKPILESVIDAVLEPVREVVKNVSEPKDEFESFFEPQEEEPQVAEEKEEPMVKEEIVSDAELQEAVSHNFEAVVEPTRDIRAKIEQEEPGIKLGDTQSMAAAAKAIKSNLAMEEQKEPIKEVVQLKPRRTGKFDTGFIVQGRYDLEAQSGVGLKAGLTEEQKKLFSYFVPIHGMSEQLVEVLQSDKKCKDRYGTSRIGNILIIGRKGSGKTVLAVDVVKAIQKARKLKQGKVGIVTAESLNKKDVTEILAKLHGGAIIIEKASYLNRRTIEDMCEIMEGQTGELLVVLEDERKPLERMLEQYPQFRKKFTSRLELPVFINDELVTFGQTYAKENGYKIDEMGILALYSRIDVLQRDEYIVTVSDVKEILDEAIDNAQKTSLKKVMKKLFGKNKDESERIILREEDFKK